jgi:hypothetical protein
MTRARFLLGGVIGLSSLIAVAVSLPVEATSAQTTPPVIEVSEGRDFVCAIQFPSGTELSFSILDTSKTQTVFAGSATASEATTCWTVEDTGVDLEAGMFVTVEGGGFVRQATVVSNTIGPWPGGLFADFVAAAEDVGAFAIYGGAPGSDIVYVIGAPEFVNAAFTEAYASGFDPSLVEVRIDDADRDLLLFPLYSSSFTPVSPDDNAPIPYFATSLPATGVAITTWSGGAVTDAPVAAMRRGCALRSLWVTNAGSFVGYIVGAPGFVNEAFLTTFPSGVLAPDEGTLLVCGT